MTKTPEQVLRDCADKFFEILTDIEGKRLLKKSGHKMPTKMYNEVQKKLLSDDEIDRRCIDGFKECVEALAAMGAKDVTIHSCNPSEEPTEQEQDNELRDTYNKDI